MEKVLAVCESCGAANQVEAERKPAALCGSCQTPLKFYGDVLEGTDATFKKEVLESKRPVLVDFWAPWCMPCKMLTPILHEVAKEADGRLKVVKINTDDNAEVPSQFGIMSIPTLLLFKNGELADRVVGAVPKKKILEMLG
jgi:thioredoxin 1